MLIFTHMNKRIELEKSFNETLNLLKDIAGGNLTGLVLKTDSATAKEIESFTKEVKYTLEVSLPDTDFVNQYKKVNNVLYKWIWTIPSLKRSYSGRLMK